MKKRPNIVVFMTDQQNGDTVFGGASRAITPNLDRFREDGVSFTQAYCLSPHCCPSRASFFSGLYPSQHGVWNNVEVDNALTRGLYDGVTLFPQLLKKSGYHTIFSGKWHVSAYEGPTDRGFDENLHEYISNYGRFSPENRPRTKDWEMVYDCPLSYGPVTDGCLRRLGYPDHRQYGTMPDAYGDQVTVDRACARIRDYDWSKPLFLYVGTTGPHDPYTPPKEFLDLYPIEDLRLPENFWDDLKGRPNLYKRTRDRYDLTQKQQLESLRHYLAFVSYEDALFGQVLETLEASGQMDNTYVLYLSDHGDYAGAHGLWAKGLPCFREAYRIPAIFGGGNIMRTGDVRELVSILDFAPTILELAGIASPKVTAGFSLTPFLRGETPQKWRQEICTQTNGNELYGIQRAVWDKQWKYVFNGFDYDELYDLERDPLETHNRINDPSCAPIIKRMCRKMWLNAKETGDNCTCAYIMVSLAPYGPGIVWDGEP